MTWLDRFLEKKIEKFVPFVPRLETSHQCNSIRDKSLVPELPQTCLTFQNPPSLLACPGAVRQNLEGLGQTHGEGLSHLKTSPALALSLFLANGTNGTNSFVKQQNQILQPPFSGDARDIFEERAGILEYEAGFTRAEAEARAVLELVPNMARKSA